MFFTLFWNRVSPWPGTFPHPICLANYWATSAQHHAPISHMGSHTVDIESDSGPCVWEVSTLLTEPSFRSPLRIPSSLGARTDWESAFAESNVGFRCAARLDSVNCFFCFNYARKWAGAGQCQGRVGPPRVLVCVKTCIPRPNTFLHVLSGTSWVKMEFSLMM